MCNYFIYPQREVTMRDCSNILYESTEMMENPTYEKSEVVYVIHIIILLYIQWNLSIADSIGTNISVLNTGVSSFQG